LAYPDAWHQDLPNQDGEIPGLLLIFLTQKNEKKTVMITV
jgi:hypothetical protein